MADHWMGMCCLVQHLYCVRVREMLVYKGNGNAWLLLSATDYLKREKVRF